MTVCLSLALMTAFYYVAWGELLKLELPATRMQDFHLFFTFRNRPERRATTTNGFNTASGTLTALERPFGFAYLPLMDASASFLPDGSHSLLIYRYDPQMAVPSSYFEGPNTTASKVIIPAGLAKALVPLRDTLAIRSFLCSTQVTQDPTILQLVSWERSLKADPAGLQEALSKLRYSPEFECIKMITQIFESLFAILTSAHNENRALDSLVFQDIVTLLGLVNDRRFANFSPVLDVYIDKYFDSSTAFKHLIRMLRELLTDYIKPEAAQQLRAAIKVWGHLFRLIIRSRQIQRRKEGEMDIMANHEETAFKSEIRSLLHALNVMMTATQPASVIGTQSTFYATIDPDIVS